MSDATAHEYQDLTKKGLWSNNPALVQLLGLCPLLAVTGSVVNAIGLGLATIFVMTCSSCAVSIIRNYVSDAVRLPAFVMIIASAVTSIQLIMQAYAYELYQIIGLFLVLITTNCAILGRADAYACKNPVLPATYDGFIMGVGFSLVLFVVGVSRELCGTGILFADMQLLFGSVFPSSKDWAITVFPNYPGYLLAMLPPGAFIFTGFLIAVKNIIDERNKQAAEAKKADQPKESRRVRVTGTIN